MNYNKFLGIINKHIFERGKSDLLQNIIDYPESFIGLLRPTKPRAKILQHLLQSNEIRFGKAFEELTREALKQYGYEFLENVVKVKERKLVFDHYFYKRNKFYFIEQKIRDDHDSSKKRGQFDNFKRKVEILYRRHKKQITVIMWFIDDGLKKNENYYKEELKKLRDKYNIGCHLFYGGELFNYFEIPEIWVQLLKYLKRWKESIPELPEVDFDQDPRASVQAINDLPVRYWRKFIENEKIWKEGIVQILFSKGETLKLLVNKWKTDNSSDYKKIAEDMEFLIRKYFIKS